MATLIGPEGNDYFVEQPDSPAVKKDTAGNIATDRMYLIDKDKVPEFVNAVDPASVDPDFPNAVYVGVKTSMASALTRIMTISYEENTYKDEVESVGTVTRSADANPIREPLEKRLTNATDIETAKAQGIDGFMRSAPKYRYRKVKTGGAEQFTEAAIISGVGMVDQAPTGIEGEVTEDAWLMTDHTMREVGGLLEEEWGWQYNREGWEVNNPDLYDVWGGSAS